VLKIKKKIGRNTTEASSFTLIVALKTIIGPKINSNIFAIVSLLQFKKAVENNPNKILKYNGTIFDRRVKNTVIFFLEKFINGY
jgi:hypothetical protein